MRRERGERTRLDEPRRFSRIGVETECEGLCHRVVGHEPRDGEGIGRDGETAREHSLPVRARPAGDVALAVRGGHRGDIAKGRLLVLVRSGAVGIDEVVGSVVH